MSRQNKQITGYRLHRERVLFSGGGITRAIKFPIKPLIQTPETEQLQQKFEEAVIFDDRKVRGDLNLNDYLKKYTHQGNSPYTLADFWLDSLRAGVIWMPKRTKLEDLLTRLYELETPVDKVWEKASEDKIKKFFLKEEFKEILLKGALRENKKKQAFYRQLTSYLKDEYKEKTDENNYRIVDQEAERLIGEIVNAFFDDQENFILKGEEEQNKFWSKNFNIDKSLIKEGKLEGEFCNITFTIIPELIALDEKSEEALVSLRKSWLEDKGIEENKLKDLTASVLALSDNFNAFSNYYGVIVKGLQADKIGEVIETIIALQPGFKKKREKIIKALEFLSEQAKLLGQPKVPGLSGWHDYRSVLGGKIQSWFSNLTQREKELRKQLTDFKESLKTVKEYLNSISLSEEAKEGLEEIKPLLKRLEQLLETGNLNSKKTYQIFDAILSALRRRLNFFYQAYIREESDETPINKFKKLNGLYARIYKPMSFFGTAKAEQNERIVSLTIPILKEGIPVVQSLLTNLRSSFSPTQTFEEAKRKREQKEDLVKRQLDFIWQKYKTKAVNSQLFEEKYIQILQESLKDRAVWKKINQNKDRYVFYRSPLAKGTLEEVKLKSVSLEFFEKVFEKLLSFASQFDQDTLFSNPDLLLDWVELSRNLLSSLIRFSKKETLDIGNLSLESFVKAKKYRELFSLKEVAKNEFSFFIQNLILSEIKGAATHLSKKKYLVRYIAQVVGVDKRLGLFYSAKGRELDPSVAEETPVSGKRKELVTNPHQYLIALDKIKPKWASKEPVVHLNLGKRDLRAVKLDTTQENLLFRLSSSPYQTQFLDKYLSRPKNWEDIEIYLGEWMFIVEREYKIEWDLKENIPHPRLIPDSRKNKLYLSIPFQIQSHQKNGTSRLTAIDKKRTDYPFLGIDVGEYGLAWVLAKITEDKVEILDKGFIEDTNIANIKDKFADIQQKARKGAFDEKSSTVAEVRQNAIGALRNQVHLVLTQNNSSVVYEHSISNFETGSGRTTRIYNSVKRADVDFGTGAEKLEHKHVWGKGAKMLGKSLNAYASSYTCSECLRSLYQIKQTDLERVEIIKREGNIITISSPYRKIRGYTKKKEHQQDFRFNQTKESLKEFRKTVRDFARPPVDKKSEVLAKFAKNLPIKSPKAFKDRRGNSAIFVCPFADCHHLADSDIQAAFMMAIRGFLNYSGRVKPGEKNGESYLSETSNYLESITGKPVIGLEHQLDGNS